MKQVFLLSFFVSIFFSSCSNSQPIVTTTAIPKDTKAPTNVPPTSTPLPSMVDAAEIVQILPDEYIDELGIRFQLISPDGEKIALKFPREEINEQASTVVSVMPINNKELINNLEIQLDRTHTYYYFDSWSPDSSAFVGGFYNADKFGGGEYCCGEAIAITSFIDGTANISIYSWDWNYANKILWSNDSSMLSITFFTDEYNTLIINRYGALIKTLEKGEKAAFWSENILYYTAKQEDKVELHKLNLNTQESSLILGNFGKIYYIAQHNNEILLTESLTNMDDIYSSKNIFFILDTNTKKIMELPSSLNALSLYPWASSHSQEYVALRATVKHDENSLWLFNWKTHKFQEYGQIKDLFGWYKNIDGFLVTTLDGEQKIIKP